MNEYYGLTVPHQMGETWSINLPLFAQSYKKNGYSIRPSDISGHVTLVDRETYENIPCLRLVSQVNVARGYPSLHQLPSGESLISQDGTLDRKIVWLITPHSNHLLWLDEVSTRRYHWIVQRKNRQFEDDGLYDEEQISRPLDASREQ